ncbi:MAG: DNA polymerase III subunit beta [Caulobacteraceae bacterium]|nr:DNA polymerase III subunit beta [Caulobacteraceae bacterium]MBK8544664.1 DNA polymerase III subunit beta [Caulobacteraceae bacterium]MBP6689738.1 DNA polymerase III subunit beta [Hyphomonadaceae bacterium]
MKLSIERSALLKALNHVQSVVERRNTIPILSNVLLSAQGDSLKLTATDLDIEIAESASAEVERGGQTTAPANYLYDFVRKLPDGSAVKLEVNGDDPRLFISAGKSRLHLPILPAGDFPSMPSDGFETKFEIEPTELGRLIDKTRFAISTEETRYYLNGIFLHTIDSDGQKLRAVATDGHRLALADYPAPKGSVGMPGVIVPRKTINELKRLLDDAADLVEISVSPQKIRFALGDAVLTSKLIDGSFPEYARVIPKNNSKKLKIPNKAFAEAVDRVATVSAERSRSVRLALDKDKITLTVNNPDAGVATEDLVAEYGDDALEIGFNARYLLDVAQQVEGENAVFELADSGSPTLVRDEADDAAIYVLMPLRV